MLRIPIPVALAVLIVAGAATVYFYVTVIQNPVQGAWSDQGDTTTYTYTVPAGGWVILGTFGGSSITITSNVTIDIRADIFTAQVWSNQLLPVGQWSTRYLYIYVRAENAYELGTRTYAPTCTSGSVVKLSNGMYMYYPNYTAAGAACERRWPFSSYTIDANGNLWFGSAYWPGTDYKVIVNGVYSHVITPPIETVNVGKNTTIYYIYARPVYAIWVRPSANASITVTIKP
jgi:hypothetical protein